MSNLMKRFGNLRSTAVGLIGLAVIILTEVGNALDGDPATVVSWAAISGAATAMALLFAKD